MVALVVVVVAKQVTADRARLAKAIVAAAPQMAAVQPVVVVLVVPVAATQEVGLRVVVAALVYCLLYQVHPLITLAVVVAHIMAQEVMVAAVMALWELVALGVMAPVIQAVAAGVLIMIQIRVVPVDRVW
jgi:hypothetical protein